MEIPPFYPDAARPYLSEIEARALFDRFETICQKTGTPMVPMMLLPFLLLPILIYMMIKQFSSEDMYTEEEENQEFNYSTIIAVGVTFGLWFFLSIIFRFIMARIRKSQLTALFEEWNNTEGVPKGLFFELGDPSGPSVDKFWNGFYRTGTTVRIDNNTTLTILTE